MSYDIMRKDGVMRWGVLWRMCYDEEWYDEDAWSCWWILYIIMYIPLWRVVLSLPTNEDETPEEFGQTVMIGHAAPGTPQSLLKLIHIRRVFTGGEMGVGPPPGPRYRHALCALHVCPSRVLTWRRPCRWHSQHTVARHYCYCSFLLNHNGIY